MPPQNPFRRAARPAMRLADLRLPEGSILDPKGDASEVVVGGVTLRAQDVVPGDIFAAIQGVHQHGARFAAGAVRAGAVAVLTDPAGAAQLRSDPEFAAATPVIVTKSPRAVLGELAADLYGDPSAAMTVVGITGTSGKTTTAYLTEAALSAAGRTTGLIGTVETRVAGTAMPSALTTPEGPELQGLFSSMNDAGVDAAVMEVSSHALDQNRVGGTHFAIAGFTNLSRDHLDYHLTMEAYFAAKSLLFTGGGSVRAARAVVCVDDEWGRRLAARCADEGAAPITVSTTDIPAQWVATEISPKDDGTQSFSLSRGGGPGHRVQIQLPGRYNVANASLAIVLAVTAGASLADAIRGVATATVPGRVERIDVGQDFLAVVDYAHKPAALEEVIGTLRGQITGRVAVVVGAGGDRDTGKRPLMGKVAAEAAELVIVTDDNPRSEDPAAIRAAVMAGTVHHGDPTPANPATWSAEVREIGDRRQAVDAAVAWARAGDVVLVAGKGHETGQEIDGVKYPFDDREVLRDALARHQKSRARNA